MQSKVTVELQTDSSIEANQSTGFLWMIDSMGDRLAQKGSESSSHKPPQGSAHTQNQKNFLETDRTFTVY